MPNINISAFDDYICDGCPMFEIEAKELYACGVVFERLYQCRHLPICQLVIPRVRALDSDLRARAEGDGADE